MEPVTNTQTRTDIKKARTRFRLLESAYLIMSEKGVDAATIAEIAERSCVGFGTFYNYFQSKDELAAQVLDCVIDDLGRRNDAATADMKARNPAAVQATSIRLTAHEMMTNPMWKWWFQRPDLLVDRMREGFRPYGTRDLRVAVAAGSYDIPTDDIELVWSQQMWMLVGGLKDLIERPRAGYGETGLIEAIMRAMGVHAARAREISALPLPPLPPASVDFSFVFRPNRD